MKVLILNLSALVLFTQSSWALTETPKEADLIICQDQAENYGNGKGDDVISKNCITMFKKMANLKTITEAPSLLMKVYGYRNMLIIEKMVNNSVVTEITSGLSTELQNIIAIKVDEKNKEIVVLEDDGRILYFSAIITGNVAPYRILKHKDLKDVSEFVIENSKDMTIVNNVKMKKIMFFSRLANINGRVEKRNLKVLKTIDTSGMNFSNMTLDSKNSKIYGVDNLTQKKVSIDLD
jgi:hypothetical protein